MTARYIFLSIPVLFLSLTSLAVNVALAKSSNLQRFVLADPVTGMPLANTPYFMVYKGERIQSQPLYTNKQGETQESTHKGEPFILVQAEGHGKEVFITNLNDLQDETVPKVDKGAAYLIFNSTNNQALCGHVNAQGFSHAYFMDQTKTWYDDSLIFQLKGGYSCAQARSMLTKITGKDSQAFESIYNNLQQTFVLSDSQHTQLLYAHVHGIIHDKNVDIHSKSAATLIELATNKAISNKNAGILNSIGYSLGFDRHEYKQGLHLLDEALQIKPKDCYASNSKGYLLMRTNRYELARQYFYDADEACKIAAREQSEGEQSDYLYPIAVNYVHLSENYALSGDNYLANDFFNRSVGIGSIKAKDEILDVANRLQAKKVLSEGNVNLLKWYAQYIETQKLTPSNSSDAQNAKAAVDKAKEEIKK